MSREQILVELEGRARLAKKLFILKSVETSIIPKEEAKTILKSFNDKASEEGPDRATSIFLYLMIFVSFISFALVGYFVASSSGKGSSRFYLVFIPFFSFVFFAAASTLYYKSKLEKMAVALTEHALEVSAYYKQHGFQVVFERVVESITVVVRGNHGISSSNNYVYRVVMFKIQDNPPPFQEAVIQPGIQYYMQPSI